VPREAFNAAYDLATDFNLLVDAISRQPDWLFKTLKR
jgi:hypothetical protein